MTPPNPVHWPRLPQRQTVPSGYGRVPHGPRRSWRLVNRHSLLQVPRIRSVSSLSRHAAARTLRWLVAEPRDVIGFQVRRAPAGMAPHGSDLQAADLEAGLAAWQDSIARWRALAVLRRWLVVGFAVALLVAGCGRLAGGAPFVVLTGVPTAAAAGGIVATLRRRPSLETVAHLLDTRFQLAEQVTTGLFVARAQGDATHRSGGGAMAARLRSRSSALVNDMRGKARTIAVPAGGEWAGLAALALGLAVVVVLPGWAGTKTQPTGAEPAVGLGSRPGSVPPGRTVPHSGAHGRTGVRPPSRVGSGSRGIARSGPGSTSVSASTSVPAAASASAPRRSRPAGRAPGRSRPAGRAVPGGPASPVRLASQGPLGLRVGPTQPLGQAGAAPSTTGPGSVGRGAVPHWNQPGLVRSSSASTPGHPRGVGYPGAAGRTRSGQAAPGATAAGGRGTGALGRRRSPPPRLPIGPVPLQLSVSALGSQPGAGRPGHGTAGPLGGGPTARVTGGGATAAGPVGYVPPDTSAASPVDDRLLLAYFLSIVLLSQDSGK
jgi:hypothetical protein